MTDTTQAPPPGFLAGLVNFLKGNGFPSAPGGSNPSGQFYPTFGAPGQLGARAVPTVGPTAGPTTGPVLPPAPGGAPNISPFTNPTIATRRPVTQGGPIDVSSPAPGWKPGDPGLFPPAPQMGMPPQMNYPGGADFSQARSWMDKAAPVGPDAGAAGQGNVSAVLGGLARGAGGVSATEPGSFAKALAMAGAGGAAGREESLKDYTKRLDEFQREKTRYGEARAGQEIGIARSQQEYATAKAQVDFQNAKLLFDTKFKNDQLQYEQNLKEMELHMPKIHNVPGGFLEEHVMPDGSVSRKLYDTRAMWEKVDSIGKAFSSIPGLDPVYAQLQAIQGMNLPPPAKMQAVQQLGIQEVIGKGLGATAFGKYYNDAAKTVDTQLKADNSYAVMSATKPADAIALRNRYIASQLMQRFSQSGDTAWIEQLGKYSTVGAMITGADSPPNTP